MLFRSVAMERIGFADLLDDAGLTELCAAAISINCCDRFFIPNGAAPAMSHACSVAHNCFHPARSLSLGNGILTPTRPGFGGGRVLQMHIRPTVNT